MTHGKTKSTGKTDLQERFPYETRILLVEDTKITRDIIHRMLYKLGYTSISEANDGEAAWVELERAAHSGRPFDLVLADWKMPRISGLDLLKWVRSHPELKNTPFVILTTNVKQEHVMAAIGAGVSNYLAKPFTVEILERKLSETWRRIRGLRAA